MKILAETKTKQSKALSAPGQPNGWRRSGYRNTNQNYSFREVLEHGNISETYVVEMLELAINAVVVLENFIHQ